MDAIKELKKFIDKGMPAVMEHIMTDGEQPPENRARILSDANTALTMLRILYNKVTD